MFLVSVLLFTLIEVGSGDITVKILGVFSTPEQRASYQAQLGLNAPAWQRYLDWLIGNDWRAENQVGYPLVTVANQQNSEQEWWAEVDGQLMRWELSDGSLFSLTRRAGESAVREPADSFWQETPEGSEIFWGVNTNNSAVKWVRGEGAEVYVLTSAGMRKQGDGPQEYIPLRKGLIRGDPGESLQTGRPVAATLTTRVRNTAILAGLAFVLIMPLALLFGIIAGVNEGKFIDRFISISSLGLTATPEFVTGVFLIIVLGIWLKVFPAVSVFLSDRAIFENPALLALPILTLTAVELGYVIRMTRASMVEVMNSPYIRTAIIKGMPYWRVVMRHAVRNALMAPITVIMLHVNWLIGGIVVIEVVFGFPGLGRYIYDAAIFGDFNAIQAAGMLMVVIAVLTRLIGDLAYTFLNPRIRYS
ncbi:ABC transporter permease subunit [bacterium]|nr:ABC transporter permease subunit [bacterium]